METAACVGALAEPRKESAIRAPSRARFPKFKRAALFRQSIFPSSSAPSRFLSPLSFQLLPCFFVRVVPPRLRGCSRRAMNQDWRDAGPSSSGHRGRSPTTMPDIVPAVGDQPFASERAGSKRKRLTKVRRHVPAHTPDADRCSTTQACDACHRSKRVRLSVARVIPHLTFLSEMRWNRFVFSLYFPSPY